MFYVIKYSSTIDNFKSVSIFFCQASSRDSAILLLVDYSKSSSIDSIRILQLSEYFNADICLDSFSES